MNDSGASADPRSLGLSQDELADIVRVSARLVTAGGNTANARPRGRQRMVTRFVAHGLANFAPELTKGVPHG